MAKSKFSLRLLGDRVLIEPLGGDKEAKTASGIILPGKEGEEKHQRGKVVAVGPGKWDDGKREPMDMKVGETVWYKKGYSAEEVEFGGKEYLVISAGDVLAVEQ